MLLCNSAKHAGWNRENCFVWCWAWNGLRPREGPKQGISTWRPWFGLRVFVIPEIVCKILCAVHTYAFFLERESWSMTHKNYELWTFAIKCPLILKFTCPTITCNNSLIYFSVQLLVNNKIISLDLPVAEVYKKVWCTTNEVCACFLAWRCGFTFLTYADLYQEELLSVITYRTCSST